MMRYLHDGRNSPALLNEFVMDERDVRAAKNGEPKLPAEVGRSAVYLKA